MLTITSSGVAAFALALMSLQQKPASPAFDSVLEKKLDDGLAVTLVPDTTDAKSRVYGSMMFDGGSVDDPERCEGLAELLSSVWIEGGTTKLPGTDFQSWLQARRASISASAEAKLVRVDFVCDAPDVGDLCAQLCELVRSPNYPEELIADRRRELAADSANDQENDARTLDRFAFGASERAAHTTTRRSALSISRSRILAWHAAHFVPRNARLGMSGAVGDKTFESIAAAFREWPDTGVPSLEAPPKLGPNEKHVLFILPSSDASVTMIAPGPLADAPEWPALELLHAAMRNATDADQKRIDALAERGLSEPPDVGFEVTAWGYGAFRAHAPIVASKAASALDALREFCSHDAIAKIPEGSVANALRSQATLPESMNARVRLERVLRKLAPPARVAKLDAASLAKDFDLWVAPDRAWFLVSGPVDVLRPQFAKDFDVRILDTSRTVASSLDGLARLDKLFAGVGGRERWATAHSLTSSAETTTADGQKVRVEQVRDLIGLRLLQKQIGADTTITVHEPSITRSLSGGKLNQLNDDSHALTLRRSSCSLVQVLHDLARGEERGVRLAKDGMLEVLDQHGVLCWIDLGDDGKPKQLGWQPEGRQLGGLFRFEDWKEANGVAYPGKVVQPDFGMTAVTTSFALDAPFDEKSFDLKSAR